jgi:predicted Ser/Thr protein kinase
MAVLARGTVVAGHRIESFVGRGGMGVVYRARQIDLDRVVALKLIAPELLEDDDIRARFLEEARAAARIDHPNVIPVHAAGEDDGIAYIAMRFVDGDDLRTLVRRIGPVAPERAAELTGQAAAALDAIHGAGFVHRDVKPANLLVTGEGHVYLTDFGLAKQVLTRSGATRTGGWVGTLDYVAPEQIRGGRIDARADVYALGGVLHFMLTGRVPFERDGQEAKLWAQLRDPPPAPASLRSGLPRALDAVVARAMAKDPEARYPSAGDLGRAVRAGAAGAVPEEPERMVARGPAAPGDAPLEPGIAGETPTASAPGPTVVLARRRRLLPALAGVAAVALGAGAAAYALHGDPEPSGQAALAAPTPTPTPTSTPAATPAGPVRIVKTTRNVGVRPSGIVLAGDDAWVISRDSPRVTRLSRATGRERSAHPPVGYGAADIAADARAVWVAVRDALQVVRLDAATGRITRRISTPTPPVYVAAGPSGLWIATHPKAAVDELLHYDRAGTRLIGRRPLEDGTGPLAIGGGAVWIAGDPAPRLMRLDLKTGSLVRWATLGVPANELRYAGGFVWASLRGLDSIARISARGHSSVTNEAGHSPQQLEVARGYVYVASHTDHRLLVLDARTLKRVGEPLPMPFNPYAVAADRRGVWVTGLGANTVTRLAYR